MGWFTKGLKLVGLALFLNNDSGFGMQKSAHSITPKVTEIKLLITI